MERKVTVQDFIDALGMESLLVSVNGEPSCLALMALYTDPGLVKNAGRAINSITFNSREAETGSLFVCKGAHFREEYLDDAKAAGAYCYVREDPAASGSSSCMIVSDEDAKAAAERMSGYGDCTCIMVSDIRKAMAVIARTFYGSLSDRLSMVGITGTKGKSTTAYFMRYILDDFMAAKNAPKSAICSGIRIYDGVTDVESKLTTPEIMELYKHMDNAVRSGISHMVMEVSSQALKYDRVTGIDFEAGAFLNIGRDHISDIEHPDFDDYLESKLRLFGLCRRACINLDCDEQERIRAAAGACPYVIGFSLKDSSAEVFGYDIRSEEGRVSFRARGRSIEGYPDFDDEFTLGVFGTLNVENALAAIALSALLGVPLRHVKAGLAAAVVPGRMEVFRSADGKRIAIVDFAHNKLSFERFYETISSEFPGKKIISVFGATGSKGLTRRTDTGILSGQYSDYTIITEDDPAYEDLEVICRQIAEAVESVGGRYEIILDRAEAVKRAIEMMDDDTLLFIAGRGRDTSMKRGGESIQVPSDVEVVEKYLK